MASTLISAKDLLLQYDFTKPVDETGKAVRGTAHEFQDYAYRLASDLNDLKHMHIYMKLAKSIPRFLLEKTYEYVADVQSDEKAKLFMWKFKQIRQNYQREIDKQNFEHDFVMGKMKALRKQMAAKIIEKNDLNNRFIEYTEQVSEQHNPRSVLILENSSKLLPSVIKAKKIIGIDECTQLTRILKAHYGGISSLKFLTKSFLKHTFKPQSFDLIIIPKIWTWIPLESEDKYMSELMSLLSPKGHILKGIKPQSDDLQGWKSLSDGSDEIYFEKVNSINNYDKYEKRGLQLVNKVELKDMHYLLLQKK